MAMSGAAATLARYREADLTLDDLVVAAARVLRRFDVRAEDGRVADGIDARGVRYYQAIGVIDKPLRYEGRRAIYGYRHLLQLLSAKRLQQEGHSLQLIQRALAGRATDTLEQAFGTLLSSRADPERSKRAGQGTIGETVQTSVLRPVHDLPAAVGTAEGRQAPGALAASSRLQPAESASTQELPRVAGPQTERQTTGTSARQAPLAAAPRLVAATVAPGVTLTVDPAVVDDPESLIEIVARVLSTR